MSKYLKVSDSYVRDLGILTFGYSDKLKNLSELCFSIYEKMKEESNYSNKYSDLNSLCQNLSEVLSTFLTAIDNDFIWHSDLKEAFTDGKQ